ncbi:hypothetical protein HZA97_03570 [Candidatus Woesearchaeota archaeon]|nr:hypothetical protein [Candidatus Woesearchaeota archaeon]
MNEDKLGLVVFGFVAFIALVGLLIALSGEFSFTGQAFAGENNYKAIDQNYIDRINAQEEASVGYGIVGTSAYDDLIARYHALKEKYGYD